MDMRTLRPGGTADQRSRARCTSCSSPPHFLLAQDAEPHLELDLELTHLAVLHQPPHLGDLEPIEPLQAPGGARDGVADGLLDRVIRHSHQLDHFVGLVRHHILLNSEGGLRVPSKTSPGEIDDAHALGRTRRGPYYSSRGAGRAGAQALVGPGPRPYTALMRRARLLGLLAALLLTGCSVLSIDLQPRIRPLEEDTVQGTGAKKILLLDLSGVLSDDPPRLPILARVQEELRKAEKDDRVKALIVRINSPGGTITASDTLYREVYEFKRRKKIPVI